MDKRSAAVAKTQNILVQAKRSELTDEELKQRLSAL